MPAPLPAKAQFHKVKKRHVDVAPVDVHNVRWRERPNNGREVVRLRRWELPCNMPAPGVQSQAGELHLCSCAR